MNKSKLIRRGIAAMGLVVAALLLSAVLFTGPRRASAADESKNQLILWRMARQNNSLAERTLVTSERLGISVMENLIKIQNTSTAESWIYNLDTRRFWVLQHRGQIFAEGTFEDLKKYYEKKITDERARLEQEKQKLPSLDEQTRNQRKKAIEQRLAFLDVDPKQFKVSPYKGETLTILGYQAKPIIVKLNNEPVEVFWVTNDIPVPPSLRKFLDTMLEIDPVTWKVEAAITKIALKGESEFGGIQSGWEAQNIIAGAVSPNEFLIPTNFSKVEFPAGLAPSLY